jgi:hypothetical protein
LPLGKKARGVTAINDGKGGSRARAGDSWKRIRGRGLFGGGMNEEITKLLVQDRTFSRAANEIFARSIERLASCDRLLAENAFVVEDTATGRIMDTGKIACGSRLCETCAKKREAREQKKLKQTIKEWKEQNPNGRLALLTIGFPPITNKMTSFYAKSAVDLYLKEATIKREIMQTFCENLARTTNFIDGYFKTEELTVSAEKFIKKELVHGNSLNLHWHILLFLNDKTPEYSDYEFSHFYFKKVFRAYLEKCKKYRLKPCLMKTPYVEKNQIKGAVVFEFERKDEDSMQRYLTKSSQWSLASEVSSASRKVSKGLTVKSILASKRNGKFKQTFVKFICLFLYNQRVSQYSKPRKNEEKKVGKVEKSPVVAVADIVKKFVNDQAKSEKHYKPLEETVLKKKKRKKSRKEVKKEKDIDKDYRPIAMVEGYSILCGEARINDISGENLVKEWLDHKLQIKMKQQRNRKRKPKIIFDNVIRLP